MNHWSTFYGTLNMPHIALFCILCFCKSMALGQQEIEGFIVETYYISDANDASDTDGGMLEEGTVVYRVFLDLMDGVRLRSIWGNSDHLLKIISSTVFFNNEDRGKTYGFQIDDQRLDENTVALDSWVSFGQASDAHFGVLKIEDTDGSIVGGINNDGGSENITGGLLVNAADEAGIPLISQDGLIAHTDIAIGAFVAVGDQLASVFKDATVSGEFISSNISLLVPEGIGSPVPGNKILIAQLATTGELQLEFNVELLTAGNQVKKFVADGTILNSGEFISPYLKYPPACGCTDPFYLEYNPSSACDDGSCTTPVILGCNNPEACNYNPAVNFNVPELCCILPDNCIGLDPSLICPGLLVDEFASSNSLFIYPNPTGAVLNIQLADGLREAHIVIANVLTSKVYEMDLREENGNFIALDVESLESGAYSLIVYSQKQVYSATFVKL